VPRSVHALALASAICSAGATILIRQGLRGGGPFAGFWINLAVGTIGLWVGVLLTGGLRHISAVGLALFVLAGLIGTVGGRLLRFVSIEKVGAPISAALINLAPLVSAGLAILLLGEQVTVPIVVGTVIIVAGTMLLSAGGRRVGLRAGQLVLPVLSATCFGVVAILRKLGLSHADPVFGSAVNATTALIAFSLFLAVSGQRDAVACDRRSVGYFVAAGLAENAGVFLTVVALSLGTVSVVTPLAASAPIFVLLLSFAFLRGIEVLSRRIVIGTVLIVLGVYLITALAGR
jgi:drug/metabolite transporter, DME family